MPARHALVCLGLLAAVAAAEPAPPAAVVLWQNGQDALRDGDAVKAIGWFEQSLRLDPGLVRNHLSLAASHVALGREDKAAAHLGIYVNAQPDHFVARAHYAELLLRLGRAAAARGQFERF